MKFSCNVPINKIMKIDRKLICMKCVCIQIVFSFWLPHIRDGKQLDFSRWQQTMIAVLEMEIIYDDKVQVG